MLPFVVVVFRVVVAVVVLVVAAAAASAVCGQHEIANAAAAIADDAV